MNIGEIIKKAGLKATPQRKAVYEIMTKLGHGSIDEIIARLRQQSPEITVSTVYRILDSFYRTKLISKMNHQNGKMYYDITPVNHHHIFMNNEVIDYIDPELTELIKKHLNGDLFKDSNIEKISVQIIINNKK